MTDPARTALAHLCQEARTLLDPELDAAALEARVLEQARRSSVDSRVVSRPRSIRASIQAYAIPVVLAAGLALVWSQWPRPSATAVAESPRGQQADEPSLDGSVLAVGQVINARDRDVIVRHPGVVTWHLSYPGRARVVEQGNRITVALDQGTIHAEVIPHPQPEVFAVELEQVRVAVHGTVFEVEREGNVAEVAVSQGRVRLGTIDQRGNTQGEILTAPMRVSLDVSPETSTRQPSERVERRRRLVPPPVPVKIDVQDAAVEVEPTVASAGAPAIGLPETPSVAEVERLWETVDREITLCFSDQPQGDPNVRISFSTRIGIAISPDGTVAVTSFDPPVPEPIYLCATKQVSALTTRPTKSGASMTRDKILIR